MAVPEGRFAHGSCTLQNTRAVVSRSEGVSGRESVRVRLGFGA